MIILFHIKELKLTIIIAIIQALKTFLKIMITLILNSIDNYFNYNQKII